MTKPTITRYRKRPVEIEARQWDGTADGATRIIDWILSHGSTATYNCSNPERCAEHNGDTPHSIAIRTLEGTMRADLGDWIIKGVKQEFYPCKPDVFAATYEPVALCQATSSAPNALGGERCALSAGHEGRHADGTLTWPAVESAETEKTARVFAALHRSAEQDVTRVIALYERWVKAGPPPLGASTARWWDARLIELHDAIRPPTDQEEQGAPIDREAIARNLENKLKTESERRYETERERDGAYRERAHLVALLAALTDGAVITYAPDVDEPGWQIVYLKLGGRQASWHISPRDADLFAHVERVEHDDPRACWDGHTTEEKYAYIAAWTADLAEQCGPECAEQHTERGRCEIARNR